VSPKGLFLLGMTLRFGSSLILLGLISLGVFWITFLGSQPEVLALLLGASLSALGLLIRRRSAARDRHPSIRFSALRRLHPSATDEDDSV